MIPQYTTPTVTLEIDDESVDLTRASKLVLTFAGKTRKVEKTLNELVVTANSVTAELSQKETALLSIGDCRVTANWVIAGKRGATDPVVIVISQNDHNEVME